MMQTALKSIGERFPLTKRDAGDFSSLRAAPMQFEIAWYAAEGLGNVSLIQGKAMGGLMRMDTLVINAVQRDLPLFSYDYIAAMGNHTMLTEYYNTLLDEAWDAPALLSIKQSIAAIPDHDLGSHWYDDLKLAASFAKRAKKQALPQLQNAFAAALDAYLSLAADAPLLDDEKADEKRWKSAAYVNGLLENGGPSTDAFCKAIGSERTRELFTRIVFGSEA